MPRKKSEKKFDSNYEQSWELVAWLGIAWEYAHKTTGEERDFLLAKASEAKLDYLKKEKAETERREKFENEVKERQDQQMAAIAQAQRNQGFNQPPSFNPPPNYPYGLPNQMPQQMMNPAQPPPHP